ncbi:MAG: ribose-phosphate pyrophosphokinase-like domain-containing protein [Candidatus Falkowbacteria bacterium]
MEQDKPIVFYYPPMENLARTVAACRGYDIGEINWQSFKDGWPNVRFSVKERPVIFFISLDHPADLAPVMFTLYQMPEESMGPMHIILPYYPVGTMERADRPGEVISADGLAKMFSVIPLSRQGGRHLLSVFDIHDKRIKSYFKGNVIFKSHTTVPLLINEILRIVREKGIEIDDIAVMLPDKGASLRYEKDLPSWVKLIRCDKSRNGDQRTIIVKDGNPHDKHVIIVDDIVNSGGTQREGRDKMIELGAASVSAYVGHGVFPSDDDRKKRIQPESFEEFMMTDSCSRAVKLERALPYKILSLAPLICEIV